MLSESDQSSQLPEENEENELCLGCMFPNDPASHFCAKCGAPMTSYAATGPFESLFAEGHAYRQAAEQPRSVIVVLGVWLLFGLMACGSLVMLIAGRDVEIGQKVFSSAMFVFSVVLIWRTTWNYLARAKMDESGDE